MPFGFVNAMQIMKRLTDVIRKRLRQWDIRSLAWVDDMVLLLGKNLEEARRRATKAVLLI